MSNNSKSQQKEQQLGNSSGSDSCSKDQEGKNPYLPVELSQQQAEARNSVLSEIKDLQLRRSSSFKRILNRMPHSWTHRTTSPLASSPSSNAGKAKKFQLTRG